MKRRRLSKRNNIKNFKRTANKIHPKNLKKVFYRGGIRL